MQLYVKSQEAFALLQNVTYDALMNLFGEHIKTLLKQRGITQDRFTAQVGMPLSSFSSIVTGRVKPSPQQAQEWGRQLELTDEESQKLADLAAMEHLPDSERGRFERMREAATADPKGLKKRIQELEQVLRLQEDPIYEKITRLFGSLDVLEDLKDDRASVLIVDGAIQYVEGTLKQLRDHRAEKRARDERKKGA